MFKRLDMLLDLIFKNLMLKFMNYCLILVFVLLLFVIVKFKLDNVNFFCNIL